MTRFKYVSVNSLDKVKEPIAIAKQLYADGARCYYGFNSFDDVEEFVLNNKKASLHEVTRCGVRGLQRLFLDIDAKYNDFKDATKDQIKKAYEILLQSVSEVIYFNTPEPYSKDAFYLDGSRDDKFSMHVIYKNIYIDGEHMKCFCIDIIAMFKFNLEMEHLPASLVKMIDSGVYGRNHCIRIHTSCKFGTSHKLKLIGDDNAKFKKETLITYKPYDLTGVQYYKCADGCTGADILKQTANLSDDALQQIEKHIDGLKQFGISVSRMDKQYPRLKIDHSLPCYVCGDRHDSENIMCVIDNNYVKLICRRQPIGSKKRFKIIMTNRKYNVDKPRSIYDIADKITVADWVPSIRGSIDTKCRNLAINAVMGTGKTWRIAEYVAADPDIICVLPTYRRGLAAKLATTLNLFLPAGSQPFESYEDIEGGKIDISKHKKVAIQYESLHRLILTEDKINLVVIDEATSFAQHTLSRLNESKNGLNQMMLRNLLENSEQNVFMDALLDEPTLDAYRQYLKGDPIYVWVVKPITQWKANIKIHKDSTRWRDDLIDDIKNGNKIYISTTNGETWIKTTKNIISAAKPDAKILMIYSGLDTNKNTIANINEEFIKYDVVIASPCISSGVSFDVKDHFDKIYVYVDNRGPNAIDVIQSLRRVRYPKTKNVIICNATYKYWLPTVFNEIKQQEQLNLRFNKNDFIHDGIELVMNGPNYEFANDCSPYLLFRLYCMRINNLNSMDIFGTLMRHLNESGCIITEEVDKFEPGTATALYAKNEKKAFNADKKKEKSKNYDDVANAIVPTAEEYEDLRNKYNGGRTVYKRINNDATEDLAIIRKFLNSGCENAQMRKYQLLRHYGIHEAKDRWKIFNDKKAVELYSNEKVMSFYKDMIYRDLPIELIEKIDAANTASMADDDKLTHKYLSGRHAIITKILEIFKDGEVEYGNVLNYIKILYNKKIPQLAKFSEPTNKTLIAIVDKLIRPYGFKAKSRRTGKGDDRKRMMFIKDYAAEIFEIKVLPFDTDIITKCITLQMGQFNKPVALVYSY